MVETVEQEALRLLNSEQVRLDMEPMRADEFRKSAWEAFSYRLIEERRTMEADHQAFREKVSEVAESALAMYKRLGEGDCLTAICLDELIIQPPVDPLVEALKGIVPHITCEGDELPAEAVAKQLRFELAKHGLKIERTEA